MLITVLGGRGVWPAAGEACAPEKVADAARVAFQGPVEVARGGLRVDLTDEVELAPKERS
jgi:hypothetical protein